MERNERYDFYKAVLMFGVVWGHTITNMGGGEISCNITWFLRLYDMLFFMLISGYFLKFNVEKYNTKQLLLNKITTILLPTILWTLILTMGQHLFSGYYFLHAIFYSSVTIILIEKLLGSEEFKWLRILVY